MLGTIVNFFAIIAGSTLGLLLRGGISERFNKTIMQGVSLCVLLIGIQGSLKAENTLVVIICMCLGGLIGEALDIDKALKNLGDKIEAKFNKSNSKISEALLALAYFIVLALWQL